MKLTAKKAVELSIELWEWLAETGLEKEDWDGWKHNGGQYSDHIDADCFLCEYTKGYCDKCPYEIKYGGCVGTDSDNPTPYDKWEQAFAKTTRKKYAKQFLEQLKEILRDMETK